MSRRVPKFKMIAVMLLFFMCEALYAAEFNCPELERTQDIDIAKIFEGVMEERGERVISKGPNSPRELTTLPLSDTGKEKIRRDKRSKEIVSGDFLSPNQGRKALGEDSKELNATLPPEEVDQSLVQRLQRDSSPQVRETPSPTQLKDNEELNATLPPGEVDQSVVQRLQRDSSPQGNIDSGEFPAFRGPEQTPAPSDFAQSIPQGIYEKKEALGGTLRPESSLSRKLQEESGPAAANNSKGAPSEEFSLTEGATPLAGAQRTDTVLGKASPSRWQRVNGTLRNVRNKIRSYLPGNALRKGTDLPVSESVPHGARLSRDPKLDVYTFMSEDGLSYNVYDLPALPKNSNIPAPSRSPSSVSNVDVEDLMRISFMNTDGKERYKKSLRDYIESKGHKISDEEFDKLFATLDYKYLNQGGGSSVDIIRLDNGTASVVKTPRVDNSKISIGIRKTFYNKGVLSPKKYIEFSEILKTNPDKIFEFLETNVKSRKQFLGEKHTDGKFNLNELLDSKDIGSAPPDVFKIVVKKFKKRSRMTSDELFNSLNRRERKIMTKYLDQKTDLSKKLIADANKIVHQESWSSYRDLLLTKYAKENFDRVRYKGRQVLTVDEFDEGIFKKYGIQMQEAHVLTFNRGVKEGELAGSKQLVGITAKELKDLSAPQIYKNLSACAKTTIGKAQAFCRKYTKALGLERLLDEGVNPTLENIFKEYQNHMSVIRESYKKYHGIGATAWGGKGRVLSGSFVKNWIPGLEAKDAQAIGFDYNHGKNIMWGMDGKFHIIDV